MSVTDPHKAVPSQALTAPTSQQPAPPTVQVFHADLNNHVALICPACHARRLLDGAKLQGVKQPATMRCHCGHVFQCRFTLQPPASASPATPTAPAASGGPVPPSADQLRPAAADDLPVFSADRQNRFTIICPSCKDARTLDGEKLRNVKQPASMKCRCGTIFKCRFKFFEPEFPPEDPEAIAPHEELDLPDFNNVEGTQNFSRMAQEAAQANRMALLTFRGNMFSQEDEAPASIAAAPDSPLAESLAESLVDSFAEPLAAPLAAEALLRTPPATPEEAEEPLPPEATENIGFSTPADQEDSVAPAQEDHAAIPQEASPGPAAEESPQDSPGDSPGMDEEEHARALAVLRLANLEKKRAREAMEMSQAQDGQARVQLESTHTIRLPLASPEAEPRSLPAMLRQREAEVQARLEDLERERQELAALRLQLEQQRQHMLRQQEELAQLLRRAAALPPAAPASPGPAQLEPTVSTFAADASGVIQVECPSCGSGKIIKAADVARVKQPARMKCKGCGAVFPCRFLLEPPPLSSEEIPTFYADLAGNVTLVCPSCQAAKTIAGESLRGVRQPASIRCSHCDTQFPCRFVLGESNRTSRGAARPLTPPSPAALASPALTAPVVIAQDLTPPASPEPAHAQTPPTPAAPSPQPTPPAQQVQPVAASSPIAPIVTAAPASLVQPNGPEQPAATVPQAPPLASLSRPALEPARESDPAPAISETHLETLPIEDYEEAEDADELALTLHADALRLFAEEFQEIGFPEMPREAPEADEAADLPDHDLQPPAGDELDRTMSPERLRELFTSAQDEAEQARGESEYTHGVVAGPQELDEVDEIDVLPLAEHDDVALAAPSLLAEVVPSVPFETVPPPPGLDIPTYYVDEKRQVMVLCPKCERGRNLDFFAHPEVGPVIRTWCKCGNEYFCRLEFRRNYRKRVNLAGVFHVPASGLRGEMIINDISLGGVGFTTPLNYFFKPETIMDLSFQLDDLKMTPIQRRVRVRSVKGTIIGTEFLEHRERDKDLGYYLMP